MSTLRRTKYKLDGSENPVVYLECKKVEQDSYTVLSRSIESTKHWQEIWTQFFYANDTNAIKEWESKVISSRCDCGSFYLKWRVGKRITDLLNFETKWELKSLVNAKLGKPNLSLDQAKWLMRFTGVRTGVNHIISYEDLIKDTRFLAQLIHRRYPNISGIAGVARSGMLPANQIALTLGVDLYEATPEGCRLIKGGLRRTGTLHGDRRKDVGPIIIVDDSTCSGHAFENLKHLGMPFYTVYSGGTGRTLIDGYVVPLELPHLFEWNLMHNGIILNNCKPAFDMDGVFCEDCPPEYDDNGKKYVEWMYRVSPLNWNIEYEIPLIVTARREQFRNHTVDWLNRYGIKVKHLEMFPGSFEERARTNIGQWKASVAKKYEAKYFIESSYEQAVEIHRSYPECLVVSIERNPHDTYAS